MKNKTPRTEQGERLQSLDALRGFDMLWIIGGGLFFHSAAQAVDWGWLHQLALQTHSHVEWEGFRFYDNIFMLFMFMSGVAIPYAITSKQEKGISRTKLFWKVLKRMALLVLLGLIYNGTLRDGFQYPRFASVLGQIGIAYFLAALIAMYTKTIKARILWIAGILGGIAILQLAVPVPGYGAGNLTPEGSINAWVDQHFLPGKLIFGTYDPEGVLCIIAAAAVTLMGTLAGSLLRGTARSPGRKALFLALSGAGLVAAALALNPVYPIIKKISTVPFNLLAGGVSFLLLALFYFVIDVKGWKKWAFPFRVIGLNSITIYMATALIDFTHTSNFLLGWLKTPAGAFGPAIITAGVLAIEWLGLYYLYKKKIFLRV
ncbi:MAG: DUF5009 domain-containing protein [Verrucomicrobiota bacterium]